MLRAKKRLGQNFLADRRVSERIVRAVAPRADETIIEIGPGRGALTELLLERAGHLLAIELDRDLIPLLHERFDARLNFTLLEADALTVDLCAAIAPATAARVVANLPYYISTAILQRLLTQRDCLPEMTLMLQSEVVERITAEPSTSERGYLSVLTEAYAEVEKLFDVAPEAFRPIPKVRSTVVRVRTRPRLCLSAAEESVLWQLVSAGFAQRRKTIYNNLRRAPADLLQRIEDAGGVEALLHAAHITAQRRAETLTLSEWIRLSQEL